MSTKDPRFRISPGGISMRSSQLGDALPAVEFFTPWHAIHEVQRSVDYVIIARDRWQDPPDLVLSFSTEEAATECYEAILGAMEGDR